MAQHTGTRPFLCYASDENHYWCKIFHGPHGWEGILNEIVASVIGEQINAPVRPWTILDIPESLVSTQVGEGTQRYRLPDAPVFASLALHTADVTDQLSDINRDGNYDRVPLLIALWYLCNADDLQVLYDDDADRQIWSIDHGLWFGSQEIPWHLAPMTEWAGRPSIPRIPTTIPPVHWDRAINAVDNLSVDVAETITRLLPEAWAVPPEVPARLVRYACERKESTKEKLRELRNRTERR
ncbi:hypothetical protein OLX12_09000 [Corynebacterium sp. 22KM0430]|nr:hypothetical protein OLX12_09000 [Corynebacterium sp. 22KM0430]WPF68191.1 hypothetical protein OLW90_08995 [Corynebacterium sp. 21KM1197]